MNRKKFVLNKRRRKRVGGVRVFLQNCRSRWIDIDRWRLVDGDEKKERDRERQIDIDGQKAFLHSPLVCADAFYLMQK